MGISRNNYCVALMINNDTIQKLLKAVSVDNSWAAGQLEEVIEWQSNVIKALEESQARVVDQRTRVCLLLDACTDTLLKHDKLGLDYIDLIYKKQELFREFGQ